jgi:hypothetical protein
MPERDELDMLIDSALTTYAQPRPGLEQRMLAHISGAVTKPSRRRWMLPAITAIVAASLLFVAYLVPKASHSRPQQFAYAPTAPSPPHAVTPPATAQAPQSIPMKHRKYESRGIEPVRSNDTQHPKLEVFPTPQPLSTGEQALIRFVAQAPEADRKSLVEAQQRADEPLNIGAIRIPPLQPPEENQQ